MQAVSENEFAAKLGLSRADLKKFRSGLKPDTHFFKNGKTLFLTPAGQIAIRRAFEVAPRECAKKKPEDGGSGEDSKTASAVVERPSANRMILFCTICGLPRQRVRVRDNSKFVAGMVIRVRRMREKGLWTLEGNCPRFRGRF